MKKIASIVLALVLVLAMAAPAMAANSNPHTITIVNPISGHQYTAYQVFSGDISDGKLANIAWGTGVNGEALLTALKADDTLKDDFASATNAQDVAAVLTGYENDSVKLDRFAELAGLKIATAAGTSTQAVAQDDNGNFVYTIPVVGDGYYIVKDTGTIADKDDAATKYILQVLKDVKVTAKADVPTLDKNIVEGENRVDYNNAAVGGVVNYELTSKVPEMDGYDKYYFIVHDTLSKGLTPVDGDDDTIIDVKITIDGTDIAADQYEVTEVKNEDGTTSIKIVFKNFIQYKADKVGKDIVITYAATVNQDAVIGDTGNSNTANLEYSNNPNVSPKGENEPSDGDDVTGETPDDTVITYVTEIELNKKAEKADGDPLEGAIFEITGDKLIKVKVTQEVFTLDAENGTYYKLLAKDKNGNDTYTTTVPNEETTSLYASTSDKYVKTVETNWVEKAEKVHITAVSGADGKLKFTGLSEGTYTITEIKAPDGYNLLTTPITVTIDWKKPANTETTCTWTYAWNNGTAGSDAFYTVINKAGTILPSTGGIGTTIFYVGGGLLIAAAVVLLVSKRKADAK